MQTRCAAAVSAAIAPRRMLEFRRMGTKYGAHRRGFCIGIRGVSEQRAAGRGTEILLAARCPLTPGSREESRNETSFHADGSARDHRMRVERRAEGGAG